LIAVWKQTGKKPQALIDQPELPTEVAYLWEWFLEIQSKETASYTEIENWSRLTQKHLIAFEVQAIRRLDSLYWQVINGRHSKSSNQS
jgi:hypothetical protein